MRISFDFDQTLSTARGQEMAREAIARGEEVFIITARKRSQNEDVYRVADELGIRRVRVIFTEGKDKWYFVRSLRIDRHIDNDEEQVRKIIENGGKAERFIGVNAGENQEEYIGRCMSSEEMKGEYPDEKQRFAVCISRWESSR